MSFEADFQRSLDYGRQAFKHAEARTTPVTPPNYEVWFNYVTGINQTLVQAVDEALERDGSLDDNAARRIHDELLAPAKRADAVADIGSAIGAELQQAISHVSAAAGTTGAYGESLEGVGGLLAQAKSGGEVQSIVETIVYATREMERNSRDLETKLTESRQQIEHLNERLEAVRTESRTDPLTGIANRTKFDEALAAELAAANETSEEMCLCLGDIDRFKSFNDTFGHQTGDQVLRLVAGAIASHVKGRDIAARYGGEEFAIILPQTNLRAAVTVANQIRDRVMNKELVKRSTGEKLGSITISFGVSRYRHGEPAEELIQRADACLYAAKDGGRNQVKCEADPGIDLSNVA